MTKTELFDAHVLAEVRPMVTNMPDQQYVAQTDGSARMRIAKFEDGRYRVRGIPGHTHNATAICSLEADFTEKRTYDLPVSHTFAYRDDEKYEENEYRESLIFEFGDGSDFDITKSTFDRAIEKAVGRIRVIPENCHNEIEEPCRSIAEVRTIVSSKDQLNSLTYVDERGNMVYPENGRDATQEFVGTVPVYILGLRGTFQGPHAGADDYNRYSETRVVLTNSDHRIVKAFALVNDDAMTLVSGGKWDGTRNYVWDGDAHNYTAPAFSVLVNAMTVDVSGGTSAATDTGNADTTAGLVTLRLDFKRHTTTRPNNRSCLIAGKSDPLSDDNLAAPVFPPAGNDLSSTIFTNDLREPFFELKAVVNTTTGLDELRRGNNVGAKNAVFHGMPVARIPVGRGHCIYGGVRRTGAADTYYGGTRSVSVPERVRRFDSVSKASLLIDYLNGLDFSFAAGVATVRDAPAPAGNTLEVPVGYIGRTGDYATATGFDYLGTAQNFLVENGPFSVRMPDQYNCNNVLMGTAPTCGGSIFGAMQAAVAGNAGALGLVAAVAAGASHDPNSAAHGSTYPRFTVTLPEWSALDTAIFLYPYTGADMVDPFQITNTNLSPEEVRERHYFNNAADSLFNFRVLAGADRFAARRAAHLASAPAYITQNYSNVNLMWTGTPPSTGVLGQQTYYNQFRANMQRTVSNYADAKASALKRHAVSKPICCTVPMHIGFVHDRLMVLALTYNAHTGLGNTTAGASQGRPFVPNLAIFTTASDAVDTAATALANAGGAAGDGSADVPTAGDGSGGIAKCPPNRPTRRAGLLM